MLQEGHDPDGKPLSTKANAGISRGPGVTDEKERKAAASAEPDVDLAEDATRAPPRS